MTLYTHTEMPGTFGNRGVRMPDGVYHPRSWFRTASPQAVSAAGFRIYTPPEPEPPTLAERRTRAITDLKALRYAKEIGGIDVTISTGVVPVSTNRGDDRNNLHIQLTAITNAMRADPSTFNLADSVPRQISNADMMTIIQASLAYVQACFDREDLVTDALDAATTHAAMDDAVAMIETGWPSTSS